MSFGFGLSDFIAVGAFAFKVYTLCKEAPENVRDISTEVHSLHAVLKEAEGIIFAQPLSQERQQRLKVVAEGCRRVLRDLDSLVEKYQSLSGTQRKRPWLRLKWGSENVTELRARLISNTSLLSAWIISASQHGTNDKPPSHCTVDEPRIATPCGRLSPSESIQSEFEKDSIQTTSTSPLSIFSTQTAPSPKSPKSNPSRPRRPVKVMGHDNILKIARM